MAMVLDAFMSSLSRVVLTMVQDKVSVLLGVPGELDKLSRTIGDVRYVLSDAERKQSESDAISRWVMELKDLMYDTDDFLELCQIKADEHRDSVASSCCFGYLVMNPGFACRIGRRIRELNSRMDGIVKKISLLGLVEDRVDFRLVQSIVSRKTDPVIVQSDIVGEKIEENCDNLMDLLTKEDGANVKENMVVVAIVGVGGIGKTTLAKRVFNDQRIKDEFHVKIWVCISKEIVERDLLKNIIREVGGHHGDAEERSELLPILEKLISRKKFFLVLDDVWRESEQSWHGLLRDPLMSGAYGSRILVTTRDQTVAMRMRAVHSLHVDKLPNEDAWSLLAKQVVLGGEEREIEHLKGIGFEILKKCNGLPLAIKVLGGVLCTKNKTESEWQAVLLNNLWSASKLPDDIHVSLYLGYEDLPAQLKQCFVFCSLYPEDWEFNSDDLANFWRAQGLLQTERASSVCDLGMEYYNELVLRNLLEPNRNFYDQARCKMHDLLRLFARYLARNESFSTTEAMNLSSRASPIKLRHLAIKEKDVVVDLLKKQESLRTLLMIQHATINLGSILDSLSSLRVLVISFSKISSLPNSLCRLVHLRFLDAGGSLLETIPEAIGKLKYLEFLNLGGCVHLTHVPSSIFNLVKLRFLNIYNTKLNGIPVGLKKLKNLVQLHGFKPQEGNGNEFSSFEELGPLSELSTLVLDNFGKVSNRNLANKANLHNKLHLKHITITYNVQNLDEDATEAVLNALNPPPCLEYLMIDGYSGMQLPRWLNVETTLHNLRYLMLANCATCQFIALGRLSNLDILRIKSAHSVTIVGNEFIKGVFPRLRRLMFEDMHNWKSWHWEKEHEAMPNLKELVIRGCPLLDFLPSGLSHHAVSLEYLEVIEANSLMVIDNFNSLEKLVLYENFNLEMVSNLPKLRTIWIQNCLVLQKLNNIANLRSMVVNVSAWENSLPVYLSEIVTEKLTVWCSSVLLEEILGRGESSFEWEKFKHIQRVNLYTEDKALFVLYRKTPFSLTTNVTSKYQM